MIDSTFHQGSAMKILRVFLPTVHTPFLFGPFLFGPFLFGLILFGLFLFGADIVRAKDTPPVATLEVKEGDCIVFLGDSITHQRLYTQYVEDFFYTRFPSVRIKFHNAGVGGAKAWDALERFDRDVAAYNPKYVTVLLGMNDGRYQSYNEEIWQTYHDDMTKVVDRIVEIGATPILMTPTMYDSRSALARKRKPADNYNSVLAYYGTWLREVAIDNGYGFVDMWGPLNNLTIQERKSNPQFTMIKDAVHPGPSGQIVMAYSMIEDMGLRKSVSNIRIHVGANGKIRACGNGGKATDAESAHGEIAFTWTPESLPWVLPAEAQEGVELLKLGHRASRQGLEIHGLSPGKYELTIDGQSVGTFTGVQLAKHIELQSNTKAPDYQQALQVATLNKQRNEGPISKLRGQWSQFQAFARLQKQANESPENEKLAEQRSDLSRQIDGMEERIAEYEAAAKKIEDEIFEINQPQPRRYMLKSLVISSQPDTVQQ